MSGDNTVLHNFMLYEFLKTYLELIAPASTIGILFAAIYGLRQISLTKRIATTQARRDAFKLATEQCNHFGNIILPKSQEFQKIQNQLVQLEKSTVIESGKKLQFSTKNFQGFISELNNKEYGPVIYELMNLIEGFAMYFTCKIADESVGFSPCGQSYCSIVRRVIPYMMVLNEKDGTYKNSISLYIHWRQKLDKENISKEEAALEKKKKKISVEDIRPLGVD